MNEIILTQAQLQKALEFYFNTEVLKKPIEVTNVKRSDDTAGNAFHVCISVKEKNDE